MSSFLIGLRGIGQDSGVGCRANAARTLCCLGYPDQVLVHIHEALALAQELSHPFSLAFEWCWAAFVSQVRRDMPAVHEQAFSQWAAWGTSVHGWALAMPGRGEEGLAQVSHGIAAWQAMELCSRRVYQSRD